MKYVFTLLISTAFLSAASPTPDSKTVSAGEFRRAVVKEVPAIFSLTPIATPKKKDFITVAFQGSVVYQGVHEIPAASSVASLFRARYGPGFVICGVASMSVLRKESDAWVVYTATGHDLAIQPFSFVQGDRVFYRAVGY